MLKTLSGVGVSLFAASLLVAAPAAHGVSNVGGEEKRSVHSVDLGDKDGFHNHTRNDGVKRVGNAKVIDRASQERLGDSPQAMTIIPSFQDSQNRSSQPESLRTTLARNEDVVVGRVTSQQPLKDSWYVLGRVPNGTKATVEDGIVHVEDSQQRTVATLVAGDYGEALTEGPRPELKVQGSFVLIRPSDEMVSARASVMGWWSPKRLTHRVRTSRGKWGYTNVHFRYTGAARYLWPRTRFRMFRLNNRTYRELQRSAGERAMRPASMRQQLACHNLGMPLVGNADLEGHRWSNPYWERKARYVIWRGIRRGDKHAIARVCNW